MTCGKVDTVTAEWWVGVQLCGDCNDPKFLSKVVIADETLVYGWNPETKQ